MINIDKIVKRAIEKLNVSTGYKKATLKTSASYFAEIPELGIRCYDFTEEGAVEMVKKEAVFELEHKLSIAKDLLTRDLPKRKKRA